MDRIMPALQGDALVIMDDIHDNCFFRDWVARSQLEFHVFEFAGKYLGLVGAV